MNGSYQIGTAFGIPIRIHWSFVLILFLFLSWGQLWLALPLFGSVLLHELGHSLVAQRFGVRVVDITLWPLGGMARLASMPESSKVEALVAIAGPAVNAVLTVLSGIGFLLSVFLVPALAIFFVQLAWINLTLGVFNLVPAFPMDGGRVLRAWLARKRDWVAATESAVRFGRAVATVMIVAPLASAVLAFLFPNTSFGLAQFGCTLPLIGLFVLFAGMQELIGVRLRHGLAPVGGARFANPFGGFGQSFGGGFRGAGAPREASYREETGRPWSAEAPTGAEPADEADDRPEEGPRRPAQWDGEAPLRRRGFDEAAVRALERFRGRLRRPDRDER